MEEWWNHLGMIAAGALVYWDACWLFVVKYHWDFFYKMRIYGFVPLILVLERLFPIRPMKLVPRDWVCDLIHLYEPWVRVTITTSLAIGLSSLLPDGYLKGWASSLPTWAGFVCALMISEVGFYFIHRTTHAVPWLWEFHRVHHSSVEYQSLMTSRFHVLDFALFETPNIILFAWLSIPEASLFYFLFFRGFMDRYGHSNINGPRFTGYLIGSPHFHAWHHSPDQSTYNNNFGRDMVFMDYIMGTAYYPKDKVPTVFGDPAFSRNYFVQQASPFIKAWLRVSEYLRFSEKINRQEEL